MAEPIYDLEFSGPFPDWWNVVDDFGADPSGVVDSTEAFQNMFNAMCVYGGTVKNGLYMGYTGYVPNGTYRISGTLQLPSPYTGPVSGEGVNLWGQDPANVILKWAGGSGQTMFWSDGCHSSTIGRITLDGQGVAAVGFQLERHPNISLQNTYIRRFASRRSAKVTAGGEGSKPRKWITGRNRAGTGRNRSFSQPM